MMLETAQEDLMLSMVDAASRVPREQQQWRLFNDVLIGPWGERQVLRSDVSALRSAGFLEAVSDNYLSGSVYVITGVGAFTAEAIREERSPGFAGQEADARRLLESSDFRQAYPNAFARWAEAEQALRSSSDAELTTVGHKAREAMQAFATELVQRYDPTDAEPNPALVKKRLGAVIAKFLPELGEARAGLFKALGELRGGRHGFDPAAGTWRPEGIGAHYLERWPASRLPCCVRDVRVRHDDSTGRRQRAAHRNRYPAQGASGSLADV